MNVLIGQVVIFTYDNGTFSLTTDMALSAKCVSKLADALKEDIINQIYEDERYMEMMTDMVGDALREKLGDIDDDLYFDLGMVLIDRIELK
jgi:hypothetical protein